MQKTLFVISLFVAVALLGCDGPTNNPPAKEGPPTLDQRLIGGRWYIPQDFSNTTPGSLTPKTDKGYYKFNDDSTFIYSDETAYFQNVEASNPFVENPLDDRSVYSKDGAVYLKKTFYKVMQYSFHDSFPYSNSSGFYLTGDMRSTLNVLASKGDLITYRIFYLDGSMYEDSGYASSSWWFLVRFNDDGTAYRDYDD